MHIVFCYNQDHYKSFEQAHESGAIYHIAQCSSLAEANKAINAAKATEMALKSDLTLKYFIISGE